MRESSSNRSNGSYDVNDERRRRTVITIYHRSKEEKKEMNEIKIELWWCGVPVVWYGCAPISNHANLRAGGFLSWDWIYCILLSPRRP